MLFHSSSSIFDGFFSIPSRALCVPSFTSNDITSIFHNKKLNSSSNFFTSNLVAVVILLTIALILLMIYHQSNNKKNTELQTRQRKCRRSTTSKQSPLNQETQDLTWFDDVPTSTERRGEIFINREENTRFTRRSLSHNSQWWKTEFFLNSWRTFKRSPPRGLYRHLGWS